MTPGAFIQISEDTKLTDDLNLISLDTSLSSNDLNSTGALLPDGSYDYTKNKEVDTETDSVCVCKRLKKPATPVRCTRQGMLTENCGERDEFRKMGFEPAPPAELYKLYPDEVPIPVFGKRFLDAEVEATAVKNIAIEDQTLTGTVKNLQKPGKVEILSTQLKVGRKDEKKTINLISQPVVQEKEFKEKSEIKTSTEKKTENMKEVKEKNINQPRATTQKNEKIAETKATETKATETKATETKATETKVAETKVAETKATETKVAETKSEIKAETKAETKNELEILHQQLSELQNKIKKMKEIENAPLIQ